MRDDPNPPSSEEQDHVGPPDLILQAIVLPTDAPEEVRAAVANALAGHQADGERAYTWEDVSFAASAIALVEGTNRRAEPDTQWVFALSAEAPKLGEQLHASGAWASTLQSQQFLNGSGRLLWQASVFDAIRTAPRRLPEGSA